MPLTTDQLRNLASLADAWLKADESARVTLRRDAAAQGAEFNQAFEAMVAQLTTPAPTALPTIPGSMRDAALFASVQKSGDGSARALPSDGDDAAPAETADGATFTHLGQTLTPPERASGQMIGPYRLIKELGRGGMGVVWLAERADGQHTRQVALKMPLVENLNWLLAARFARERNILASLEHPGIARLYDAGVDNAHHANQPFIAIEYVQGQPITTYVKDNKLKPEATVQLFTKVIEAVAHAHTQLVIHRDIKPTNILVDGKGEPHLLDFGIAKLLDDEDSNTLEATQLTKLSGRALTLDYASPEQINNASLGTASDVYSLGVVLYELLTGTRPYHPKGPTRRDLEQAILDQDPQKPSEQLITHSSNTATSNSETGKSARRMRGDLDTIVLKALRKDPKQRYATAQAFADDLKRYLAFEPIAAKPDDAWYRIGRFVRRHRVGLAAVTAVVLALGIGLASTLWQAQQTRIEAARANAEALRANAEAMEKAAEATRASAAAADAQRQTELAVIATARAEKLLVQAQGDRKSAIDAANDAARSRAASQAAAITAAQERDDAQRQRAAAIRQSEIATKEANRADIVGNFMMDAFVSARPGKADAPPVTVLKALEDAVERARADVNMPPEGRVPLLLQMGDLLQAHGKLAESRKLLEENFADAERRLGGTDLTTLNVGIALGRSHTITGRYAEARVLFDRLIANSGAAPATITSPLYASSAVLASRMQEKERAIRESELGYSLCKTDCASDNRIERASEYANVLATFGLASKALTMYRELDPLISTRYGARSMRRATLLAATSRAARLSGDLGVAVSTVRQALEIDDAVLPPTDFRRARHLYFLALALIELRDFSGALEALRKSLSIEQTALGLQHLDLASTHKTIASVMLQLNDNKGAAENYKSAYRILQSAQGAAPRDALDARAGYGYALVLSGEAAMGQAELAEAITGLAKISPFPTDTYASALERRALLAIDAGDADTAILALREVQNRVPPPPDGAALASNRLGAQLGWALILKINYADALAQLAAAERDLKASNAAQAETAVQITALQALALKAMGDDERYRVAATKARDGLKNLVAPLTRTTRLVSSLGK